MKIHIGVVTWNRLELTKKCLDSLFSKTKTNFTLTIVDNGSCDGTREFLTNLQSVHTNVNICLLKRNMGVAVASNMAWDFGSGANYFVKLDNDIEIRDPYWLERLVTLQEAHPEIGPLGYRVCPWHTGEVFTLHDGFEILKVPTCNGACTILSASLHEKLGFWNEGFGHYGFEDLEYSWRASKAGFCPAYLLCDSAVVHNGYVSDYIRLDLETIKKESFTSNLCGEKRYILYLLLYEKNVLPLKIPRKYEYKKVNGEFVFTMRQSYKSINRILNTLLKNTDINNINEKSQIRFLDGFSLV